VVDAVTKAAAALSSDPKAVAEVPPHNYINGSVCDVGNTVSITVAGRKVKAQPCFIVDSMDTSSGPVDTNKFRQFYLHGVGTSINPKTGDIPELDQFIPASQLTALEQNGVVTGFPFSVP
jgi:hypothetical protein